MSPALKVRIRELEDGLLHALSNVTGSILEDEAIVSTLETLKCEAAEVRMFSCGPWVYLWC